MEYAWVDKGLESLGFRLDINTNELPMSSRSSGVAELSVDFLMKKLPELWDEKLVAAVSANDKHGKWFAEVGLHRGNGATTQRTIIKGLTGFDVSDYLKLFVDDAMVDVARAWDETFVEGGFEYIITKDGRVFKAGEQSIDGVPAQDVAKVMRWVFAVPGLMKREIVSVYVTYSSKDTVWVAYFPVHGDKIPLPKFGRVRGRLMMPCFDRAVLNADGTSDFYHCASAALMGWMPNFFISSRLGKKQFLSNSCVEADNFVELLSKKGVIGGKFVEIPRRDGTSFI